MKNRRNNEGRFLGSQWWIRGLICLLAMIGLGTASISAQVTFTDVQGKEWFAADVMALAANSNEIIKGYPDG
ncbi:S-layer homology domain-containing protein, partial [Clostridiales bacterium COT073_COT-073]